MLFMVLWYFHFMGIVPFPPTYLLINILHAIHLLMCFVTLVSDPVQYTNRYGGTLFVSYLCLRLARAEHTFLYGPFRGPLLTFFKLRAPGRLHPALAFHWRTTRLSTTHFSPNSGPFFPHSALRYSHQSPHSIPYDVTPATTPHDTHSSSSQLQDGGPLPTRRCSLLPTLRNTIYHSIRRHQHFPSFFPKFPFSKIFWALSRGLLPLLFEFQYSRCISSDFFRRFDLYFHFLLHGPSIHLLLGLVNICFRSKVHGGPNPASYYCCVKVFHTM